MKGLGGRNVLLGFILGRKSIFSEQGKLQNGKKLNEIMKFLPNSYPINCVRRGGKAREGGNWAN